MAGRLEQAGAFSSSSSPFAPFSDPPTLASRSSPSTAATSPSSRPGRTTIAQTIPSSTASTTNSSVPSSTNASVWWTRGSMSCRRRAMALFLFAADRSAGSLGRRRDEEEEGLWTDRFFSFLPFSHLSHSFACFVTASSVPLVAFVASPACHTRFVVPLLRRCEKIAPTRALTLPAPSDHLNDARLIQCCCRIVRWRL